MKRIVYILKIEKKKKHGCHGFGCLSLNKMLSLQKLVGKKGVLRRKML
jgi:hypothetical protein